MNLLQIKQKMQEKSISESYMADCCGVCKAYLHNAVTGTIPLTKKLHDKIEHVFKNIEIGESKKESTEAQKKDVIKTDAVQRLINRKKILGCSYKDIAKNTEKPYSADYIYMVFAGKKNPTKRAEKQIMDALDAIANKKEGIEKPQEIQKEEPRRCKRCGREENGYGSLLNSDGLCFDCQALEQIAPPAWIEPNIWAQLRQVCGNIANLFGETQIDQQFMVMGKDISVQISIKE